MHSLSFGAPRHRCSEKRLFVFRHCPNQLIGFQKDRRDEAVFIFVIKEQKLRFS